MTPIFRWDGRYWGFTANGNLFNRHGEYRGWIESDGSVWRDDGTYLGEMVDGHYILRSTLALEPAPRLPHVPPACPIPPVPSVSRVGRVPEVGYQDALAQIG